MKPPKKIYLDAESIEEGDNYKVDAYLTPNYERRLPGYISVESLKNFAMELTDQDLYSAYPENILGQKRAANKLLSFILEP